MLYIYLTGIAASDISESDLTFQIQRPFFGTCPVTEKKGLWVLIIKYLKSKLPFIFRTPLQNEYALLVIILQRYLNMISIYNMKFNLDKFLSK